MTQTQTEVKDTHNCTVSSWVGFFSFILVWWLFEGKVTLKMNTIMDMMLWGPWFNPHKNVIITSGFCTNKIN